jgi:transposase
LVGGIVPGIRRDPLKKLAPDAEALLRHLRRWRDEAIKVGHSIERMVVAFEAGYDGFWLARWLRIRDIEAHVIHPTSVAVSRERLGENRPAGYRASHVRCNQDPYPTFDRRESMTSPISSWAVLRGGHFVHRA